MVLVVVLAALCGILAGYDSASWWIGAPAVFATAWFLRPARRTAAVRTPGLAAFALAALLAAR